MKHLVILKVYFFYYSYNDRSGIDYLPVGEAIAVESKEDEGSDSVQDASTVQVMPSAATFTWEYMKNYIREENSLLVILGPRMKQQMLVKVLIFSYDFYSGASTMQSNALCREALGYHFIHGCGTGNPSL